MCEKPEISEAEVMPVPSGSEMIPTDPAVASAAEFSKQQIILAYYMADRKPRDRNVSWNAIMKSCQRPALAKKAIWRKPIAGTHIEGPSIRLAEEMIVQWGNVLVSQRTVYEDAESLRVNVLVIDLETNAQYATDINLRKTVERKSDRGREVLGQRTNTEGDVVYIVTATEDEMANKVNNLVSKAIRNNGLRIIPADVKEDSMAECRRTRAKEDAQDPDAAIKHIVYVFGKVGVDAAEVAVYLGHSVDQMNTAEIDELRDLYTAIKDGDTTWRAVMDGKGIDPSDAAKDATKRTADTLKAELAAAEDETVDIPAEDKLDEDGLDWVADAMDDGLPQTGEPGSGDS